MNRQNTFRPSAIGEARQQEIATKACAPGEFRKYLTVKFADDPDLLRQLEQMSDEELKLAAADLAEKSRAR